jgi:hypothetical protein
MSRMNDLELVQLVKICKFCFSILEDFIEDARSGLFVIVCF